MAEKNDSRPDDVGTAAYEQEVPHSKPGRYAIKKFHARGGMGEVWQAEDVEIGRVVALKRLRGERSDQTARFMAEAQITGQLEHPGIVPVHDLGTGDDNRPFYIMPLVGGRTLKDVIADYFARNPGNAEPREVERRRLLDVFVQVCKTIAYAHSKGVVHRDLKPDNIMIGRYGEAVVLDWGLAKVQGRPEAATPAGYVQLSYGGTSTATQYGSVIGAPPYMPPEVAEGKATEADERTDVYLLGGTLYEILTGRAPRQGSSKDEMIELARTVPPVPPRQVNPEVAPALNAICTRALAHRKQDRYAGAAELAQEVERYQAGEPVAAYPESLPARAWRWCKRHRRALGRSTAAVLLLGLLVGSYVVLDAANRSRVKAEAEAAELRERKQAGDQVKEFRRLADELHFQAASLDAVNERAPYYNLTQGEDAGQKAWDVAQQWGPQLENLPLPEERSELKAELYAVLLLFAQLESRQQPAAVERILASAETLGIESRSLHRLRATYYDQLPDRKKAARERALASDARTPATALDLFLEGEQHRVNSGKPRGQDAEQLTWRPNRDHLQQAVTKYRAVLDRQPSHYWANYQLARCLMSLDQTDEAVMALGVCVGLRPDAPWGWSTRGFAQTRRAKFNEAEHDLAKALELEPTFAPALLNRGNLRWKQRQLDRALVDFDAVTVPLGSYYRGRVLLDQGKYEKALRQLDAFASAQPKFADVHLQRARACFALGKNKDGLAALDAYLSGMQAFDAQAPEAGVARGTLLRRLMTQEMVSETRKRLAAQGLAQLKEAEKRGVESADLYRELGAIVDPRLPAETPGERDRANRAIKYYSRGLEIAPAHAQLRLSRGIAYIQHREDYKSARADLEKVAALQAVLTDTRKIARQAHVWLGLVCVRQNLVAEALDEAALALLYGHDEDGHQSYIHIHNVACIFGELSVSDPKRVRAHQDVCLGYLEEAVALARRVGKGPNELADVKNDPSLRSLRKLPRFQKLIGDAQH